MKERANDDTIFTAGSRHGGTKMTHSNGKRGAERIHELQTKFPAVPRSVVLKLDFLNHGVRRTPGLATFGAWAVPVSYSLFHWDMASDPSRPDQTQHAAWVMSPWDCYFQDGTHMMLNLSDDSPYEIRPIGYPQAGRYRLHRDSEPVEEVYFNPRPSWYTKRSSDGTLLGNIMSANGEECLCAPTLKYCEYYFKEEEGCRYCSIGAAQTTVKALGLERKVTVKPEHFYEAYTEAIREHPIRHILMIGGSFLNTAKETEYYIKLIRAFQKAIAEAGAGTTIAINPNALTKEDCLRLV